ncbi:MAG: type I toxin-antitoxin system SymE family toxin [Lachnospiraceae bacterium]|nr:type I toxin-antitoxin system SymE family toxin [Lachnospiraceae bacterium]
MAKKNVRDLKVCAQSGYNYKSVPSIRLMGQWLEEAGFHIGDPVTVKCEDGKLIIALDTARAELIEAEKLFMERETRKLQERFAKEKKELRAQFVAERQAEYAKDHDGRAAYV